MSAERRRCVSGAFPSGKRTGRSLLTAGYAIRQGRKPAILVSTCGTRAAPVGFAAINASVPLRRGPPVNAILGGLC